MSAWTTLIYTDVPSPKVRIDTSKTIPDALVITLDVHDEEDEGRVTMHFRTVARLAQFRDYVAKAIDAALLAFEEQEGEGDDE